MHDGQRNAPYNLGLRSVLFALATGNTTILKGSEYTPRCYWAIYDVLREAGLPDGCLNLLFHSPAEAASTIDSLVSHPLVKKINFTGSTGVGRIISATAGKHLKPVLMELGGKASAIVLKDADLEQAARHCVQGAFLNVSDSRFLNMTKPTFTDKVNRLAKSACPRNALLFTNLSRPNSRTSLAMS
jgi:acyl-CoA reductase-like NAD-dependent aldehyde dehydrogenase